MYLCTEVNASNDISKEINLYKILVRPLLTCGSEAWAFTKMTEKWLFGFERIILKRIFCPVMKGVSGEEGRMGNHQDYTQVSTLSSLKDSGGPGTWRARVSSRFPEKG